MPLPPLYLPGHVHLHQYDLVLRCLVCRYVQGYVTGQWFTFFAIQGPIVLMETLLLAALARGGVTIPKPLAVVGALTVLIATGDMFFFPPCLDTGLADRVVQSIKGTFDGLLAVLQP